MNPLVRIINTLITKGFEHFGKYYSSYRGFVIDNEDPEGYGRVKLRVPQVFGTNTLHYWAWQKGCFSGKGFGTQCIPPIGSMVFVEFEFGDTKKPIWTYGHFGRNDDGTPEKDEDLKGTKKFWFKTPGGLKVILDDENGDMTLKTEGENEVIMSDTDKVIRVKTKKGFYIELNDTGISLVADKVSLVELDGAAPNEPAILGDKNEDTLKAIYDALDLINQYLTNISTADAAGVATAGSTYGIVLTYPTVAATTTGQLSTKLADIQTKISKIKSTKVTLS